MYTIKSIIPFNLLVDTDMGLIKYTQLAFAGNKEGLFYPNLLNMIGPEHTKFLQYALINRNFPNPLSAIVKEEKMLICNPDKIVETLYSTAYNEILRLSTNTAIMNMICKSFFLSEILQFDILCENFTEKNELIKRFKTHFKTDKILATVIIGKPKDIDLSNYGNIYIKDVHDIEKYKEPIEGKNIIIAKYKFNNEYSVEEDKYIDVPLMDVINKYTSSNEVKFIDVYADIDNGVG